MPDVQMTAPADGRRSAPATPTRPVIVTAWLRDQPRTAGLARALGTEATFMPWAWPRLPWPKRILSWCRSAVRTAAIVRRSDPDTLLVCMSPPVFCALVGWAATRIWRRAFVIDLHSGGLNDPNWRWSFGLQRWLIRRSDAVVVTNDEIIRGVDLGRARIIAMHDPWAPSAPAIDAAPVEHPYALFPASGMPDEPVAAVAEAAALLGDDVRIVVTGREQPALAGTKVVTTGYVSDQAFADLLGDADVVLALTTREATMQRAAYEAIHVGRPLVCSDTAILVEELGDAAVFSASTGASLASAITEALERADELVTNGARLVRRMDAGIDAAVAELVQVFPAGSTPQRH